MFNVFKKVLNTKAEFTDEDISKVSDFVFCRWLSGNSGTLQIAQMFNYYYNIPIELKLRVAQKIINGRLKFIPYPKSIKNDDKDIENVSKFFNVSLNKAKMYMEFISDDEMKYINTQIKAMDQ